MAWRSFHEKRKKLIKKEMNKNRGRTKKRHENFRHRTRLLAAPCFKGICLGKATKGLRFKGESVRCLLEAVGFQDRAAFFSFFFFAVVVEPMRVKGGGGSLDRGFLSPCCLSVAGLSAVARFL